MKAFLIIFALVIVLVNGNEAEPEFLTVDNDTTTLPGSLEPSQIVSNGYSAHPGKAPYIVSLVLGTDGSRRTELCAGAIIANNFVLTAGHCLRTDYVDIHYGSNLKWQGLITHKVRKDNFIRHPNYETRGNDIGLIRTPQVQFSAVINKVKLPESCNDRFESKFGIACGWGEQADGTHSESLKCVELRVMYAGDCSVYFDYLNSGTLCAIADKGLSTCGGDSGAPFVSLDTNTLMGIASFVSGVGCTAGYPAGFTNVATHFGWISGVINPPKTNCC